MDKQGKKPIIVIVTTVISICGCAITLVTLLIGNNLLKEITGRSIGEYIRGIRTETTEPVIPTSTEIVFTVPSESALPVSSPTAQPVTPEVTPTIPINTNANCLSPEDLAKQKGWQGQQYVDEYGGYKVVLERNDILPELWEVNGDKQIRQLDIDRNLLPGNYIIYTPFDCREQFGFASGDSPLSECIKPDLLAERRGWKGSGYIDKFGGYKVQLDQNDELPPLWEANGPNHISQLDVNRQMSPGTWTIYTPFSCRTPLGFEK